ncbi:hypothetical protein MA16_Dca028230 [Dendrobium catenatum]|uniref:Uncharacterized protein n=1 Tax=Dendrobium catenatum TaxID=906689 RepID=A0A2I0VDB1_9ASPA|nr:hypothetical protein MA16_Dca028230 [Dendrobium catenatum]
MGKSRSAQRFGVEVAGLRDLDEESCERYKVTFIVNFQPDRKRESRGMGEVEQQQRSRGRSCGGLRLGSAPASCEEVGWGFVVCEGYGRK